MLAARGKQATSSHGPLSNPAATSGFFSLGAQHVY